MADPVSWKVVEPGWAVVDSTGEKIGELDQVLGDPDADIFDGLAVRKGADLLRRPKYVPAERVGAIEEGTVHLELDGDAVEQLEDYEPPPQAQTLTP